MKPKVRSSELKNTKLQQVLDDSSSDVVNSICEIGLGKKSAINYEKRIKRYYRQRLMNFESLEGIREEYFNFAYEIIGCMVAAKTKEGRVQVIRDMEECKIGWDCSVYDDHRRKRDRVLNFSLNVEDGEFQCKNPRCLSKKCFTESHQTRSGDEGMTHYVICTKCSRRYKIRS